ncbi:MAG: TolC family protein [Candidatus Kapaibacteriales bacterium]
MSNVGVLAQPSRMLYEQTPLYKMSGNLSKIDTVTRYSSFLDGKEILEFDDFMNLVQLEGLLALVANNAQRYAEAGRDAASGIYDPFLYSALESKSFQDKNYFNIGDAELRQFTPFGAEFKAGLEHNTGVFVNPQNNVPLGGLGYLGVEMPLLNGLLTDERRNELDLAENFEEQSSFDRQSQLNNLGLSAAESYWEWWRTKEYLRTLDTAIKSSSSLFLLTSLSFRVGSKPAMDTLLSLNQVLTFKNIFANAYGAYVGASNRAALFADNDIIALQNPVSYLLDYIIENPDRLQLALFNILSDSISLNNPEVRLSDYKIRGLEIERELKEQKLLPKLNAKYNLLAEEFNYGNEADKVDNLFTESIKWGFKFEYPLFITQARNELEQNTIKIETAEAQRNFKLESIRRKLDTYNAEINSILLQIQYYQAYSNNYEELVRLERLKYSLGDGDLFQINYIQLKYIEAKLSLIDYKAKLIMKLAGYTNNLGRYSIEEIVE